MAILKNTRIDDTGFIQLPSGTTAQRPASPIAGMIRYNTSINATEIYTGTTWIADDGLVRATASGAINESSAFHQIFTFLGSGSITINTAGTVEYLIVAGGGAGGYYVGGGGGGGGYLEGSIFVNSGTYAVTVGAGGIGERVAAPGPATNGANSSVFGLTAIGGGGGGNYSNNLGRTGGSAGGAGGPQSATNAGTRVQGTTGQGGAGGAFLTSRSGTPTNGSGGGGAGTNGLDELAAGSIVAPAGGQGRKSFVCPFGYYYSGGGGGGSYNASAASTGGDGGVGGGGGGGTSASIGTAVQGIGGQGGFSRNPGNNGQTSDPGNGGAGGVNTGGGSGGAGHFANGNNSSGGSGIVIIKFLKEG